MTNSTIFELLINDVSGRYGEKGKRVNFYEWLFIRNCAVAWSLSSGMKDSITRDELLDIGLKVIPHYTAYEGDLKNVLFSGLDF